MLSGDDVSSVIALAAAAKRRYHIFVVVGQNHIPRRNESKAMSVYAIEMASALTRGCARSYYCKNICTHETAKRYFSFGGWCQPADSDI